MRRWMIVGALVVVVLILGGGGGYVSMKLNNPDQRWVPLLLNPELPEEKREQVAAEIRRQLMTPERLAAVVRDLDLVRALRVESEADAIEELERRAFVRVGEAATPAGVVPALHVGMTGKRKERGILEEVTMRLLEEVQEMVEAAAPAADTEDGF